LSIGADRQWQRFVSRRRAWPEQKKLKARPKAEALLTSEGVSPSVLTRREAPC
jgi:hypothetical protein